MRHSTSSSRTLQTILALGLLASCARPARSQESFPDAPWPRRGEIAQSSSTSKDATNDGIAQESSSLEAPPNTRRGSLDFPGRSQSLDLVIVPPLTRCPPNTCSACGLKMTCGREGEPFEEFLRLSGPRPLRPRDKLIMAGKDIIDPFNILTIVGGSAVAVASNADSVYGPGMPGFARDMGVSFAQDVTGEFFGTFLIPSLAGQDPRFHRMPNASLQRRLAHAVYQVVWTQSDTGKPMFNYATVVGTMADDLVSDFYVPGRRHNAGATAARLSTALATDPIDNFVSEFLPDIARHVNIHVVFVQRIINRVALDQNPTRF